MLQLRSRRLKRNRYARYGDGPGEWDVPYWLWAILLLVATATLYAGLSGCQAQQYTTNVDDRSYLVTQGILAELRTALETQP